MAGLDRVLPSVYIVDGGAMYLIQGRRKRPDGSYYTFWVLRETVWDKSQKRPVQKYLGYVGRYPVISEKKAKQIAKKIGCSIDDLRRVKGLKIIES